MMRVNTKDTYLLLVKPLNIGNNIIHPSERLFILTEFAGWRNKGF